ncbi:serine/threonine-protein kinase [Actinomadura sp. NEAU-AAG7]|uniref:serine/threonine-protein kinase n=1 Tax=Actinomadura sp. NEAU-AAG7 TaxID=2839640 RepID=UPI001BE4AFBE|nr:serine/threonine-protein kinase [Actinomadura sp. NEAU-AAG7]MBT2209104.1 serine/threonine protein kinase [Actinomadura sp. NEAU-AAG7]
MPPLEPTDPRRLGVYKLTARLGEGGQGVVYLGHTDGGPQVAVKLFHTQPPDDPDDMFGREMEAAKQVARFCTAQVLDSGTIGSRRYIVSEYIDGPPLSRIVAEQGPRTGSALDRLAIATATALVALHDAGVVHRDFKPQNVLIGADGPRVIDFGISRALTGAQTMVSRAVGTPAYMAPEQLQPGELGPAADVFAWASTMVFAATGRPPFGNESIPIVFNRIAHEPPHLGTIEEPLRSLLTSCFAKNPADRPSAHELLDRLVRPAGSTSPPPVPMAPSSAPVSPDATTTPHGPAPSKRKKPLVAAGIAAAIATAAIVLVVARLAGGDSPDDTARVVPQSPSGAAAAARPSATPTKRTARPAPSATPRTPRPSSSPSPSESPARRPKLTRAELGPGHFSAYCVKLGWEWVEYRETPTPGAYCIKRKGATMRLTGPQLDAGCRWRFTDSRARHYFKGKSNYCYTTKPTQ